MQISFSDVIKCIDKTDHNFLTAGNFFMKYSDLLL
jgi:hypothetical protein